MEPFVPKPSNTYKILTFVFLTTTIVLGILLFNNYSSLKNETIAKNDAIGEKQEMIVKLESLKHDYQILSEEHENIKELFEQEKQKIEELIQELQNTKGSVQSYKAQIAKIERKLKEYLKQISELKQKNEVITVKNVKLTEVLDSTISVSKNLKSQNSELSKQVQTAAVLKAYEKVAIALKVKNGKEMPTTNSKKTDRIKVCFVLSENSLVTKGSKNVYLRIVTPDGRVLFKNENDAFKFNGSDIQFTAKNEINYLGKAMDICMYYDQPLNLTKGTYEIDIFVDGTSVGTSAFTLE